MKDTPIHPPVIPVFNYLRGLSILFIVLHHFVTDLTNLTVLPHIGGVEINLRVLAIFSGSPLLYWTNTLLAIVLGTGWHYVGVFIFLSGFGLTYGRLHRETETSGHSFLKKRLLRIIPYWHYAVLFSFVVSYIGEINFWYYLGAPFHRDWYDLFYLLLFPLVVDFNLSHIGAINNPLWFVVLLFQFYLLYDLLYFLMHTLGVKRFVVYSFLITIVFRYVIVFGFNQIPNSIFGITPRHVEFFNTALARLFEFDVGMVVAWGLVKDPTLLQRLRLKSLVSGIILWLAGYICTFIRPGWIFSDIFITSGLVLFWIPTLENVAHRLIRRTLQLLSESSFLLYLYHQALVTFIVAPVVRIVGYTVGFSVAFLCGLTLWFCFIVGTSLWLHYHKRLRLLLAG